MDNIFEANKVVNRELYAAYNNLSIPDSAGYINIADGVYKIDCRGYNYLVLNITSMSEGAIIGVNGGAQSFSVLDIYDAAKCKRLKQITSTGTYYVNVSKVIDAGIYCSNSGTNRSISVIVSKLYTCNDIIPKVIQLATGIVTCNSQSNTNIPALSNINMSDFRFFVVRIKTVPNSGEDKYVRRSASIAVEHLYYGLEYPAFSTFLESDILTLNNEYVKVSDWNTVKSSAISLYVKSADATAQETKQFEVTLMGIR